MSFCNECQPFKYCKAGQVINTDAALIALDIETNRYLISLEETPPEEKGDYERQIEEWKAEHEDVKEDWRARATRMLCPNLEDLP